MTRFFFDATLLATAVLAIGLPVNASHCMDYGPLGTGLYEITGGSAGTTFYLDDHDYLFGNGIWLAEESNGVWEQKQPGVYHVAAYWDQSSFQTGSCSNLTPNECGWEGCDSDPNDGPDQIIF